MSFCFNANVYGNLHQLHQLSIINCIATVQDFATVAASACAHVTGTVSPTATASVSESAERSTATASPTVTSLFQRILQTITGSPTINRSYC